MIIAIKQGQFVVVDYPMCTCVIYVKLLQCTIGIILVYILRSTCPYILSIYFLQNRSSWNFLPEENSSSEYMISSFRPKISYKCSALKRSTSKTFHFSLQCLQSNMKASHYIKKCKKCLNSCESWIRFLRPSNVVSLHKKWSFPLRISSINVTKSTGNCEFGQIYWRNS